MTLLLALVVLAAPAAPPARSAEVASLIEKTVAAYGGKKALSRPLVVQQRGKVASTMRKGAAGDLVRLFQRPDRLRVEIRYPAEEVEVRILSGGRCWRGTKEVSGPPRDAVLLQAARFALPLSLLEQEATVKDLGTVERDGKQRRVLELPVGGSLSVAVEIDPATGRILRSTGREALHGLEFIAEYSDFRMIDGLLFAFSEQTFAMGTLTSQITLEKIELLATAPQGAFELAIK